MLYNNVCLCHLEDDSASVSSNTNEAPDTIQSKKSTEHPKVSQPGSKTDPKSAMRTSGSSKGNKYVMLLRVHQFSY